MTPDKILITGASGFIGSNLATELRKRSHSVTCLVRPSSRKEHLRQLGCDIVVGELVPGSEAITEAVAGQDVVYHLAATTKSLDSAGFWKSNVQALDAVLSACAQLKRPPRIVHVSSIAAVGPSRRGAPHTEQVDCHPVSRYGSSKAESELLARRYSDRLSISIVRPPIVLGPGDHEGFTMFKAIEKTGTHAVPGFETQEYSLVDVADLVNGLIMVAEKGQRLSETDQAQGVYFIASDQSLTYEQLGTLVAKALGRSSVRCIHLPLSVIRAVSWTNLGIGKLLHKPLYLNPDKAREIVAGSWACSNQKICKELGFAPIRSIEENLERTVHWYREHGWLPKSRSGSSPQANLAE